MKMEAWQKVSILLCIFGVIKEFRPIEPYFTKYLNNPPMNFTLDQIGIDFYPISTYTSMGSLVVIFLLLDILRYKPVIIFGGMCAVVLYALLIVESSVFWIQVVEVLYGLFFACNVAYYAYIYGKVEKCHYQEVSGYTRAAMLIGRTISGVTSQLYIYLYPFDYFTLNYFTFGGMIIATIWAVFLPPVEYSLYFDCESRNCIDNVSNKASFAKNKISSFRRINNNIISDFYCAFSNFYTLKWIFWWCLATGGYYQVVLYGSVLWEEIIKDGNLSIMKNATINQLNGGVDTIYTLLSAGSAFGCGILKINWNRYGEIGLVICSITLAALLLVMSQTREILLAFGLYIVCATTYNGMITIANSEIAKHVNPDSHGLIFGITTFLALVIQSILTAIVSSKLLDINERTRFVIYGCYFGALGLVFAINTTVKKLKSVLSSRESTGSDI